MLNPPSVNQIKSAYTGQMPALTQRIEKDKQENNGVAKDLRMLLAEADMAKALQNQQNQTALSQPQNPPTVAQTIHNQVQQMMQGRPQMQPQASQPQQAPAQGLPQLQAPAQNPPQAQGIDQIPTNVGQAYANGGIIGYAEGDYVDERDALRRMEAQAYEENNPPPKAPQSAEEVIMQAMQADPAAKRKEAEERRNAIKRDTSAQDQLVEQLKSEDSRLNAPKEGYAAFMDYISKIATAPKGLGSLSAGAYGAQQVNAEQEARAAKQHELKKQMFDVMQKKSDLGYQQKLDVFGAGEGAEAAAIKDRYAAAINRSTNQMERDKLAQEMELSLKRLEIEKARTASMHVNPLLQIANAIQNAKTPEEAKRIEDLFSRQYGDKMGMQTLQAKKAYDDAAADIDKSFEKDLRKIGGLPNADEKSKAAYEELQREKNAAKLKAYKMYFPETPVGLPALSGTPTAAAPQNPSAATATPKVKFLGFE
jgi:hypothetical protein